MKNLKIKELKDDVTLDIKVNKNFYMMSKAAIFVVFKSIYDNSGDSEKFLKNIISKDYKDMNDGERTFYTLSLLVGEIEKQATLKDAFIEKDKTVDELKSEMNTNVKSNKD